MQLDNPPPSWQRRLRPDQSPEITSDAVQTAARARVMQKKTRHGNTHLRPGQDVRVGLDPSDDLAQDDAVRKNVHLETQGQASQSTATPDRCSGSNLPFDPIFLEIYLLIVQLPSQNLRCHPVGGAHDGQRLLPSTITVITAA